jgi:hypothetical protein
MAAALLIMNRISLTNPISEAHRKVQSAKPISWVTLGMRAAAPQNSI